MSSSAFACAATLFRFAELCRRKTIRNVTRLMVISPTLCQVSDQAKIGPAASHAAAEMVAPAIAHGEPAPLATASLKRANLLEPVKPLLAIVDADDLV